MRLTKRERAAFEFLSDLANAYLQGELDLIDGNEKNWTKLKEIGIEVTRINHKKVKKLKSGKSAPITRAITNAPWYIRGKSTKEYLPFQVAELKKEGGES